MTKFGFINKLLCKEVGGEMKISKLILTTIFKCLVIIPVALFSKEINVEITNGLQSIYCEDINKSHISLKKSFAPIVEIDKIWFETLNVNSSRFVSHFYKIYDDFLQFKQNIPVKDANDKYVEISYRDNSACSVSRYILVNKKSKIFLLTSRRSKDFPAIQKYEPSPQKITIYVLYESDSEIMEEPIFFKHKSTFETSKSVCDGSEIRTLFHEIISTKL